MKDILSHLREIFTSGFVVRYLRSESLRVRISLLFGLCLNLFYLVSNFIFGIKYNSPFFLAVSLYYLLIFCIRYVVFKAEIRMIYKDGGLRVSRISGGLLLITDLVITLLIVYSLRVQGTETYGAFVFSVLFVYALYSISRGAFCIVKIRKDGGSCVQRSLSSVRIAAALMSVFNLLSALLLPYSDRSVVLEILLIIIGITVSVSVLYLSLWVIYSEKGEEKK